MTNEERELQAVCDSVISAVMPFDAIGALTTQHHSYRSSAAFQKVLKILTEGREEDRKNKETLHMYRYVEAANRQLKAMEDVTIRQIQLGITKLSYRQ